MTTRKSTTAKKRTSRFFTPAAKPMYGRDFATRLQFVAVHITAGENTAVCPGCSNILIPGDITGAEYAHREAVAFELVKIARKVAYRPEGMEIELVDAPAGLPIKIARDVLYILRAVAA